MTFTSWGREEFIWSEVATVQFHTLDAGYCGESWWRSSDWMLKKAKQVIAPVREVHKHLFYIRWRRSTADRSWLKDATVLIMSHIRRQLSWWIRWRRSVRMLKWRSSLQASCSATIFTACERGLPLKWRFWLHPVCLHVGQELLRDFGKDFFC